MIRTTPRLKQGGTLAVHLACEALRRSYRATIFTYDMRLFDPTWFRDTKNLANRLKAQASVKEGRRLHTSTDAYLEYLRLGGEVRLEDLTTALLRRYLNRGIPILAGLSANYLYRSMREWGPNADYDDVHGEPAGHFVVLCGYDKDTRHVLIADPLHPNPVSDTQYYEVHISRLICAIMLGVLTYDANLLILQPGKN